LSHCHQCSPLAPTVREFGSVEVKNGVGEESPVIQALHLGSNALHPPITDRCAALEA